MYLLFALQRPESALGRDAVIAPAYLHPYILLKGRCLDDFSKTDAEFSANSIQALVSYTLSIRPQWPFAFLLVGSEIPLHWMFAGRCNM